MIIPQCTIDVESNTELVPADVLFTGTRTASPYIQFDYIDYGDGTTGIDFNHTYSITGALYGILRVSNIDEPSLFTTCSTLAFFTREQTCGDSIPEGTEQCDE